MAAAARGACGLSGAGGPAGIWGRAAVPGLGYARALGRVGAAGHGRNGRGQGQDGGTGHQRTTQGHVHAVDGSQARRSRCPVRGWAPSSGEQAAGRRQVQMLSLAVLGAKLEAGCGVVRGPALAVLP